MTQTLSRADRGGTPSLIQLWLGALLCVIAMSAHRIASVFRMRAQLWPSECHTRARVRPLPGQACDPTETISGASNAPATSLTPRIEMHAAGQADEARSHPRLSTCTPCAGRLTGHHTCRISCRPTAKAPATTFLARD